MRSPADVGSPVAQSQGAAFGDAFVAVHRGLRHAVRREVGLAPLPEAQRELLLLVSRQPGITVGGAAEALQLAPNTISTLLRQLVGVGYLDRTRDPENLRVVHMSITERARDRISRYSGVRNNVLNRAFEVLSDEERADVEAVLPAMAKLAAALEISRPPELTAGA